MASIIKEMQNVSRWEEVDDASKYEVQSIVISLSFALSFKLGW